MLMNSSSIFNEDTMVYVMPEERSIDLDAELDFEFVEFLMKKNKKHLINQAFFLKQDIIRFKNRLTT